MKMTETLNGLYIQYFATTLIGLASIDNNNFSNNIAFFIERCYLHHQLR